MHVCTDVFACMLIDVCSHCKLCAHVACTAHVHLTNEQVWMLPYMIVYLHDGMRTHSVTPPWPCACACVLLFMSVCCTHVLRSRQRELLMCVLKLWCLHACTYACMHVCVYVLSLALLCDDCLLVYMYICMYVGMCVHMHVLEYVQMCWRHTPTRFPKYLANQSWSVSVCMYTCACVRMKEVVFMRTKRTCGNPSNAGIYSWVHT